MLHEGCNEVLEIHPEDVVERVEVSLALPGPACDAQVKKALQVVVDGIAGDAGLSGQGLQALGVLDQPGEQLHSPAGQDLRQGRGPVGVVETLESFCGRRSGEEDLASCPLHQANILQASYDPGDRALQEVQFLLQAAGMHWLPRAGDEDQGADFVLAQAHYLNKR